MRRALIMLLAMILLAAIAPRATADTPKPALVGAKAAAAAGAVAATAPRVGAVPTIRDPDPNTIQEFYRWGTAHHNDGSAGNDEWWITGTSHYSYNDPLGERPWARPSFSIAHYNQEGTHMGCNDLSSNELIWVKVDFYFWDKAGRNYNPGPIYLPCREDTTATKHQDYLAQDVPKLRWVVAGPRNHIYAPSWKFTWRIIKYNGVFEGHGTVQGKFRPCSGERYEHCPPL